MRVWSVLPAREVSARSVALVFFLLSLCAPSALAQRPGVEDAERIIAARQSGSSRPHHLDLGRTSPTSWTARSHGSFAIEVVPSTCRRAQTSCPPLWLLSGQITSVEKARQAWEQALHLSFGHAPLLLVLDSSGGDTNAALFLADQIRAQNVDTKVESWGTCTSACVYLLAAGHTRQIEPWALVGIHAQNSSDNISENTLRTEAATNPYVAKALTGQEPGLGNETRLPLHLALGLVDNVSRWTQYRDGRLVLLFSNAGVSPLLLTYMVNETNTSRTRGMTYLPLPCSKALSLDNQTSRRKPYSLQEIQEQCGKL